MHLSLKEILRGRPAVAFGAGESLDRAIRNSSVEFEYFVDERMKGDMKHGREIYGIDRLRQERREVVIFVFEKQIAHAIRTLKTLGFEWLQNVFDSRFFGLRARYFDRYEVLDDEEDVRRSDLIQVYSGSGCQVELKGLTIPWEEGRAKTIRLYLGNDCRVSLRDVVIEEGASVFAGSKARISIGPGTQVQAGSQLSAAVSAYLEIGKGVLLSPRSVLDAANHVGIEIGDGCTFGENLNVWSYAPISIGPFCMFSSNIYVESGAGHDLTANGEKRYPQPMKIGREVWVGWGASLLGGTSIGDGSMVGAMSVVNREVGAAQLVAGNPARPIRDGITWQRDYTAYKEMYQKGH